MVEPRAHFEHPHRTESSDSSSSVSSSGSSSASTSSQVISYHNMDSPRLYTASWQGLGAPFSPTIASPSISWPATSPPLSSPTDSICSSSYFSPKAESSAFASRAAHSVHELHPSSHVLVLGFEPSPGSLQVEGLKSGSDPGEEFERRLCFLEEDTGEQHDFCVYVFESGRFTIDKGLAKPWGFASPGYDKLGGHLFFDQQLVAALQSPRAS